MDVPLGDLVWEVKSDEVAALDKYEGRRVSVTGSVSHKGLKTRTEVAATLGPGNTAIATTNSRQVPFAVMEVTEGSLVCFFQDKSEVAALKPGSGAVFVGYVYRVKNRGEMALVYMTDCAVEGGAEGGGDESSGWEM